jgi:hypothetical protein
MASKRILNVVAVAGVLLSVFAVVNAAASNVWVQKTQLEQFWSGGQWKDSTSDTNAWLNNIAMASTIHSSNINPSGLIDNTVTLNSFDADNEMIQQLQRTFNKAQGVWADTIAGTIWTRYKDNTKRDTVIETQTMKVADKKWYKSTRTWSHFATNGLVDTLIQAVWDTSSGVGVWLNTTRQIDTYVGQNSIMTTIDYWLKGDARWLKTNKESRIFSGKQILVDSSSVWDTTGGTGKYVYTSLLIYAYDGSNDTSKITLTYNKAQDNFLNSQRETYAYDANGNLTVYVKYRWTKNASAIGIWLQVSRETQTYNANSQIVTTLDESYDSTGAQWNKGAKEEWAYDGNNNAISETFSNYDTTVNPDAFVPFRKLTWTYMQETVGIVSPFIVKGITDAKATLLVNSRFVKVSGLEGMEISVFGINGRKVATISSSKGSKIITWNYTDALGNHVAKGSYVMKVTAPGLNKVFPLSICR